MSTESNISDFYSHDTDLYNSIQPRFRITSKRMPLLVLRSPIPNDASDLLRILTDERNIQHDRSVEGLGDPAVIDGMIKKWSTFTRPLERANVVIVVDGKTVGIGGFGHIGKKPDGKLIGDAGIMLDSDLRGEGYAYETLRITIDHGFRVLGLDGVQISCTDVNTPMKGLMNKKFGFVAIPLEDKRFGNDWLWKITRDEWLACAHSRGESLVEEVDALDAAASSE
jgi:RimJ/RimL family protein N-acetyltransferase